MTNPGVHASGRDHSAEWDDRLQEWLDDSANTAESSAARAHLAACEVCQAKLERLQQLDSELSRALPPLTLDDAFDAQILARIDTFDDAQRAQARQRIEQELQQNLRSLTRAWRQTLMLVIPGVFAGAALAFALNAWLDDTAIMRTLIVESAAEFRGDPSTAARMLITAVLGTTVGTVIARWLASIAE